MKRTSTLLLSSLLLAPLFAAQGGPDAFGYTWKDSAEPDGPVFNWIDISTAGTLVTGLGDDNVAGPYVMLTNFEYYWYNRKFIWIGSNGYVAFMNGNIASPFPTIPLAGGTNDYIAGLMSDLNFGGVGNPGQCRFYDDPDLTVISYLNVPFWTPVAPGWTGSNTFQIILSKVDSTITIQYLSQSGITQNNDIKVGIESVAGTIGLQHSSNIYPQAGYAVRFYRPASTTLAVTDASVIWNGQDGTGGIFRSRNGAPYPLMAKTGNIGNQPLAGYTVTGTVLNAIGQQQVTGSLTVGAQGVGVDTLFTFPAPFNPTTAGIFRYNTTISGIASELVTSNNVRTQEIVVVDTTAANQLLNYHGTADNGVGISWNGGNGGVGVYIKPPYYPAFATAYTIRIVSNTGASAYALKIYDDNGPNGGPGTRLDSVYVGAAQATAGDQVINLSSPLLITSGGVYVQWYMLGANVVIAVDANPPFSLNTYEVIDGVWAEYRDREAQDFFLGLRLSQVPVTDIGCTGFFGLTAGQDITGPTAIRAWVTNFGNQPVSAFNVNYRFGSGNVVSQAYSGAALNPGQQTLITFNNYFNPTADATADLCAWTTLAGDASAVNDTACLSIDTFVGIDELGALGARLAPVPAQDELRIIGLPAGNWRVTITDAAGRAVMQGARSTGGDWLLDVSAWPAGAYQLVLQYGEHLVRSRFAVSR